MAKSKPVTSEMTGSANWRDLPIATGLVGIAPFATVAALKSRGILTMGQLAVALDDAADIGLGMIAERIRPHGWMCSCPCGWVGNVLATLLGAEGFSFCPSCERKIEP